MPLFLQDLPICRPHWRLYTAVGGSSFFLDAVRILFGGYSHGTECISCIFSACSCSEEDLSELLHLS